jgi:uncharacterized RDD family membrane protein YckC
MMRDNPHTPAIVTPSLASPVLQAPSLVRRMACWLYEGLLLFGVTFIADYLISTLSQTRHALDNRHFQQAFLFLVLGIYFTWFWSKGQTLAMKTWHIKLVNVSGQPVTQARALLRYLAVWIWLLPPLAALTLTEPSVGTTTGVTLGWITLWASLSFLRSDRQFLHDALSGTRLITFHPIVKKV